VPRPGAQTDKAPAATAGSGEYKVKEGDTLGKIARQNKLEGISLDQMLVALQRANPNAFIGNNMNRLRAGQILTVPDATAAGSVQSSEAHATVVAQAADFSSYQQKLAGQVAAAPAPKKSEPSKQSAGGKIVAKVEEKPTPASEAKDKLKLSKSGAAATAAPGKGATAPAAGTQSAEDRIAKEKALAEANSRVKELEKNVGDLQKLLEIKNKDLAEKQKQIEIAKAAPKVAAPVAPAPPVAGKAPAAPAPAAPTPAAPAPTVKAPVPPAPAAPAPAAPAPKAPAAVVSPGATTATPAATPAAVPSKGASTAAPATVASQGANTAAGATAPVAAAPTASTPVASAPAATPPVASAPAGTVASVTPKPPATDVKPKEALKASPPPPETSLVDDLLGNTMLLALVGVVLAGLAGFAVFMVRRKKQQRDFQDSNILTDSSLKANSIFGSTGGASVDTNNSVFNSNFAPSSSQLDTNEVDPVAEADVYIAYGRDAQAEEILKEALRTQPERNAVRVKLLEIYSNRKDTRAFEILATELYSLTKGEGDDWDQATSMGAAIDPGNPLYAGGKPPEGAAAKGANMTAPTQPLEELDLDALLNTTQGAPSSIQDPGTAEPSYFDNTVRPDAAKPPAPAPMPEFDATMVMKKAPDSVLDFDATMPIAKAPAAAAPAPAPAPTPAPAPESDGLDFDFDMASLNTTQAAPPPAPIPEVALPPEVPAVPAAMDFDFQPNIPDLPVVKVEEPPAPSMPEVDFSLGDLPASATTADVPFDPTFDIPSLPETPSAPAPAAPDAMEFDLSGISLDLNPAESKPVSNGAAAPEAAPAEAAVSNVAEMATKLDLALAYQEIGDKEGARELLDEVVKGGSGEQTEKAKAMLQKMA
jgi:pilus assembly protein FimV